MYTAVASAMRDALYVVYATLSKRMLCALDQGGQAELAYYQNGDFDPKTGPTDIERRSRSPSLRAHAGH